MIRFWKVVNWKQKGLVEKRKKVRQEKNLTTLSALVKKITNMQKQIKGMIHRITEFVKIQIKIIVIDVTKLNKMSQLF